jgi:hypothetical protein
LEAAALNNIIREFWRRISGIKLYARNSQTASPKMTGYPSIIL